MLDQIESNAKPSADDSAKSALQEEALNSSDSALNTSPKTTPSLPESEKPAGSLSANEQRKADEEKFFRDMYEKANFELEPMKKGEGPYQVLKHMDDEGKIEMSDEQIAAEAARIAERDFKDMGRNFYKTTDHVKLFTNKEIDTNVQSMVDRVKGIDVSNWQGNIDWKQVKDAGYQFAFMKATEGVTFVDKTFAANRQGAQDNGLKVGYYHYFHPSNSVDQQVKLFSDVVGKAEPDALRVVIDAEDESKWTPYSVQQRVKMVEDFLKGVQEKTGARPSVYCSPNFAKNVLGSSPDLAKYSLWIANYGVDKPTLPAPWGKWDFWQFTDRGRVPGIQGNVDINVFNGTDLSQDNPNQANQKK